MFLHWPRTHEAFPPTAEWFPFTNDSEQEHWIQQKAEDRFAPGRERLPQSSSPSRLPDGSPPGLVHPAGEALDKSHHESNLQIAPLIETRLRRQWSLAAESACCAEPGHRSPASAGSARGLTAHLGAPMLDLVFDGVTHGAASSREPPPGCRESLTGPESSNGDAGSPLEKPGTVPRWPRRTP